MTLARWMLLLAVISLSGCGLLTDRHMPPPAVSDQSIFPFSSAPVGVAVPPAWKPFHLSRLKRSTEYLTVNENGRTVVRAIADRSASGMSQPLQVDVGRTPFLTWSWNVSGVLREADNINGPDDAPARIIVAFEGDKGKLDFEDVAFADRIRSWTGHEVPYATLMYIWSNREPVGSVITNRHTSRIKMVVAQSGAQRLRTWVREHWNVREDFRRAFGEEPGRIISIGIMSDTDNTGEHITTYYGDIALTTQSN